MGRATSIGGMASIGAVLLQRVQLERTWRMLSGYERATVEVQVGLVLPLQ